MPPARGSPMDGQGPAAINRTALIRFFFDPRILFISRLPLSTKKPRKSCNTPRSRSIYRSSHRGLGPEESGREWVSCLARKNVGLKADNTQRKAVRYDIRRYLRPKTHPISTVLVCDLKTFVEVLAERHALVAVTEAPAPPASGHAENFSCFAVVPFH